jgi:hypothetical protein
MTVDGTKPGFNKAWMSQMGLGVDAKLREKHFRFCECCERLWQATLKQYTAPD